MHNTPEQSWTTLKLVFRSVQANQNTLFKVHVHGHLLAICYKTANIGLLCWHRISMPNGICADPGIAHDMGSTAQARQHCLYCKVLSQDVMLSVILLLCHTIQSVYMAQADLRFLPSMKSLKCDDCLSVQ